MANGDLTEEKEPTLSVVALGAICELEDLTGPPRLPTCDAAVLDPIPHSTVQDSTRAIRHQQFFTTVPSKMMQAQRKEWLESGTLAFYLEEFADLSNGQRVILKDDRGWNGSYRESRDGPWKLITGRELTKQTILVLDPDDEVLWMEDVIEELRLCGINVDPASVHAAPFRVEFGPRLQSELRQRKPVT